LATLSPFSIIEVILTSWRVFGVRGIGTNVTDQFDDHPPPID